LHIERKYNHSSAEKMNLQQSLQYDVCSHSVQVPYIVLQSRILDCLALCSTRPQLPRLWPTCVDTWNATWNQTCIVRMTFTCHNFLPVTSAGRIISFAATNLSPFIVYAVCSLSQLFLMLSMWWTAECEFSACQGRAWIECLLASCQHPRVILMEL